jgi:C4-dicarboxylate transporter DctQ subunit
VETSLSLRGVFLSTIHAQIDGIGGGKSLKKIISVLDVIYNKCIDYLFHMAEVLVIVMMLVVVADVTIRYTMKGAITWGFEFTEYALAYMTFLGTAWLLRNNGHVKMDVINNVLKPAPKAYLSFVACIILLITCALLLWYGASSTIDNIQNNVMSVKYYSVPKFIFIIIIPISSFLLLIQALKQTVSSYRLLKPTKS